MDSIYRPVAVYVTLCILCLSPVNPLLESGQLIKTDSCTCPEGIITYQCIIDGTDPGGFTIWNGTAFNCGQSNNILLRHNRFGTTDGAFGSCNNGIISGRSLGVREGNIYTSQLQVNLTSGSSSDLVGRTVQCVYSPDGSTNIVINSTTILITDPLPPPSNVQLTHVKPNQLMFNWSSVQSDCSTLQYDIQSNCGTCMSHPPTMLTSTTCSFELSAIPNGVCNFAVRNTICDNISGSFSDPVVVTLKIPDSPAFQSVIPTYNQESKTLMSAEVTFADVDSFNISNMVDGSALYYIMNFIDSNRDMCNSSNVSASSCVQKVCVVSPVYLAGCARGGSINVSVSAFNLLGKGQAAYSSIDGTNQYFDVTLSRLRVVCTFRSQPGNQILSNNLCSIAYGPSCQQPSTIVQNTSDSSTVVINLQSQLSNGNCYTITASNGTSTTKIQGTFTGSQGTRTVAIAVGVTFSLVVVLILATVVLISIFAAQKYWKARRYRGKQEVRKRLLDETDSGEHVICPHVIFDLEDKPEKLTEALRTLSQNSVNIKNIKICPCGSNKFLRTVYVECDHDLEMGVKEQLENKTQLGLPGTLKIITQPESMIVNKDEDANSKRVKEIEEFLKHEPGALCSWLEMFREAEELRHMSITDIIHEDVAGRENCKRVIIKFIPELSRNWKDKYYNNQKRKECGFIVSEINVNATPV